MEPGKFPSAELIPALILHTAQRDQALGLHRAGQKTISLLSYHRIQERRAIDRLAQAAFLKALPEEARTEIKRLIETEDDTPSIRQKVERLMALAIQATDELEKLAHA